MKNCLLTILVLIISGSFLSAQGRIPETAAAEALKWRMIGPFRGGRTVGVAGVPDQPNLFYIGVNNGGVWKTDDAGRTWDPIFDDQATGSIGAIAVAPSVPAIIYVGSGEGLHRPDLSVGDGVFVSTDAGATWNHRGLTDAQQISAVVVDPGNAAHCYVGVLGHPYGANEERGVYETADTGHTWKKILYVDENTGISGLVMDPVNPAVIYASLWSARQGPWENGGWQGTTSGLRKSTDGGGSWHDVTMNLPKGTPGRIGLGIAPSNPARLYALMDAPETGGLYRSDDAGNSWVRVNSEDRICGRGDDFAEVKVDPRNRDVVYVANTSFYRSDDGGRRFTAVKGEPGGDDYHSIWINPLHPEIILLAADQGACVSVNGGRTWSSWYNQPSAQLYHVSADNGFPYRVYSGQQESGSAGVLSRGNDGAVTFRDWHPVGADEYATVAPDPLHPGIVYGGRVTRTDCSTGMVQNVSPEAVRSGKYRVLRTAPLQFSPVNPKRLYFGTNVLFVTDDGGYNWSIISPDLSREHPEVPASIGIFTTPDLGSQPRRGVIYALGCSPLDGNVLWAGTDDGLVHRTSDGGTGWNDITPPGVTSWSKIAAIDPGHADVHTAYIAVNRLRLDDLRPHIYRTRDDGRTWTEIVNGLPASGPVNVVREDPVRKGLLFAGTEREVYVSFDDGDHWISLRRNMPATSIRDLIVHGSDLVVATHGRSFWIMDNITPLRQATNALLADPVCLFAPDTAVRVRWNNYTDTPLPPEESAGENPPDGAMIDYHLASPAGALSVTIEDAAGSVVRKYTSLDLSPIDTASLRIATAWIRPWAIPRAEAGTHRFVWDLHYPPPEGFPPVFPISAVLHNTAARPVGPFVAPGRYRVQIDADGVRRSASLVVTMDPRCQASRDDLREQFTLAMRCYRGMDSLTRVIREISVFRAFCDSSAGPAADPPLADSLRKASRSLLKMTGGDIPDEDVDQIYFTTEEGSNVRETFTGLRTKLLSLMSIVEGADARPTTVQKHDIDRQVRMITTLTSWWHDFRKRIVVQVRPGLRKSGITVPDDAAH